MHSDFSEWFRSAGIEMPSDALLKRWEGIEAHSAGAKEIISLTELFFGYYDVCQEFSAAFRLVMQGADASFRMKGNNLELSVIAGAKLISIIEGPAAKLGDLAALALVACAAQNLRKGPCVVEIPKLASKHLNLRAISRSKVDPATPASEATSGLEVVQLQREIAIIAEESNILWWVFGECSRDLEKRWSDCSVGEAVLTAGKELADLSRIEPGPASAAALLNRVVKIAKPNPRAQVSFVEAIGKLSPAWRQSFVKSRFSVTLAHLCPVSNGIRISVELEEGEGWIAALPASTKIERAAKIKPYLLSYQIFIECLLSSLFTKVK